MKNIDIYKCRLIHVRKKHKRILRGRLLRGKERKEAIEELKRAKYL